MSVQFRDYYIYLRSEFACYGLSVLPSIVQTPVKEHLKSVFYSGTLIKYVSGRNVKTYVDGSPADYINLLQNREISFRLFQRTCVDDINYSI